MRASDQVLKDGLRDRSFAGLFAYTSNVPMKVFAGNEPAVPVSVLVDALDALQSGHASKHGAAQMHGAATAHMSKCQEACMGMHGACMQMGMDPQICVSSTQECGKLCENN